MNVRATAASNKRKCVVEKVHSTALKITKDISPVNKLARGPYLAATTRVNFRATLAIALPVLAVLICKLVLVEKLL